MSSSFIRSWLLNQENQCHSIKMIHRQGSIIDKWSEWYWPFEKLNKNIHALRLSKVKDRLHPLMCTESTSTSRSDKENKAATIPALISQPQELAHQALCIAKITALTTPGSWKENWEYQRCQIWVNAPRIPLVQLLHSQCAIQISIN